MDISELLGNVGIDIAGIKNWNAKRSLNGKMRARIYNKLASLLDSAMPLPKALKTILAHTTDDGRKPNIPVAIVLRDWIAKVANGKSFGSAIKGWVPDSDRIVIEAGDRSGTLSKSLRDALFIEESNKKIRSAIKKGVAYPLVLITAVIGLLLLFGLYIIPTYEETIPKEKWTGGAALMIVVSDIANYWILPLLVLATAIFFTIQYSMPRWVGPTRAKFDKFPPWSIYRLTNGAGFMLSVSSLLKGSVALPDVLITLKRGSSPWYSERITAAKKYVDNGVNLGQALHLAGHDFPDKEAVVDMRSFADLDDFSDKLEQMGKDWVKDSVIKIETQMNVFKTIAIVIMGLFVGAIIFGSGSITLQMMAASTAQ